MNNTLFDELMEIPDEDIPILFALKNLYLKYEAIFPITPEQFIKCHGKKREIKDESKIESSFVRLCIRNFLKKEENKYSPTEKLLYNIFDDYDEHSFYTNFKE